MIKKSENLNKLVIIIGFLFLIPFVIADGDIITLGRVNASEFCVNGVCIDNFEQAGLGGNITGSGINNRIAYWTTSSNIGPLATINNGILVTDGSGIPSIATDIPTGVTIGTSYIYRAGGTNVPVTDGGTGRSTSTTAYGLIAAGTTATGPLQTLATGTSGQILRSGGSSALPSWSTATYPATASNAGRILRADGTNWVETTATYPATTTGNQILYSSSANTVAGLATQNNGVLVTSGAGVPSIATDIPTAVTIGSAYIYRAGGTNVAVTDGGTGASNAEDARSNLGLGTIATQNANSVALTGGAINGITIGATTASTGAFTTLTSNSLNVGSGNFTVDSNGNVYADGNIRLGGNLILDFGDINLAEATVIDGDLNPNVTGAFDIGSSSLKWKDGYFSNNVRADTGFCIGANCITGWASAGQNNYVTGASFTGGTLTLTRLGLSNLTATVGSATTSAAGIVQLSTSTSSTSTSLAATASAVKAAYDLANSKDNYVSWTIAGDTNLGSRTIASGDTMTIAGGNGISTFASENVATVSIDAATCGAGQYSYWSGTSWLCRNDEDTTYDIIPDQGLRLSGTSFGLTDECSDGQVLKWDEGGEQWRCDEDDNTNTATAANNILKGSNIGTQITYAPYPVAEKAAGRLYTGTTNPTNSDRLNYDGYFYATRLYDSGSRVVTGTPWTGEGYALSGACPPGQFVNETTTTGVVCAAPAGGISGSGTASRIAFWDGASSLSSNANLYWDNSNSRLGIGTASPSSSLHVVNGALLASGTTGATPVSGGGTRMMWIPAKGAFRAGTAVGTEWDDVNIGHASIAFGYGAIASGDHSFATSLSHATGESSIALGSLSQATGEGSIALGGSQAKGLYSTALGLSTAEGDLSISIGYLTNASGESSLAMGSETIASGIYSTAMGLSTTASGAHSTAMGMNSIASGVSSIAMGYQVNASGAYSIAAGQWVTAGSATNTIVIGKGIDNNNRLTNNIANSLMVGFDSSTPTFFVNGSAVGIGTTTPGAKLDVEVVSGGAATIGHSSNVATGDYAIAIGKNAEATGSGSFAHGYEAFVMGKKIISEGDGSIAMGHVTNGDIISNGTGSVAMGSGFSDDLISSKMGSISMGVSTKATASGAIALGGSTLASGTYSFASGDRTVASNQGSTAMGRQTTASGIYSTSMGVFTTASGDYSFSIGKGVNEGSRLTNNIANSLMIGFDSTTPTLFVNGSAVGIGITSPSTKLDVDGQIRIRGGSPGAGKVLTSDANGLATWETASGGISGSGTATRVAFWDGASSLSSNANLYWDNSNSRLGIGTASPSSSLHVVSDDQLFFDRFANDDHAAALVNRKSRGTSSSPSIVQVNDAIASFQGGAYNGLDFVNVGNIRIRATSISGNNIGAAFEFVNSNSNGVMNTNMVITSIGNVGIGTTTPSEKLEISNGNIQVSDGYGIKSSGELNMSSGGGTGDVIIDASAGSGNVIIIIGQ